MKTTLLILSLTLLQNCSKSDDTFTPTLPPITQTGENTFGAYIDGKLLTPRDGDGTFNNPDRGMRMWGFSSSSPDASDAKLSVRDFKSGTGGLLKFYINDLHISGEGDFIINESNNCQGSITINNINIVCRWWDETAQAYKWYCSIESGGVLTITRYDAENFIVSGIFSCTVQNRDDPNDIIEITEGRFDINRSTLEGTNFP